MATFLKDWGEMVMEVSIRILLLVAFCYLERCPPYQRPIQPEEVWLYSNPIKHNTVNTPQLFFLSLFFPVAFILTHYCTTRQMADLKQGLLGITLTACVNGVVTNLIKVSVGRPRPDFIYRCFPDGEVTSDLVCVGDPADVEEGRKSFPSGHSSWVFSCFCFLSLYLIGKLQCFRPEGRGQGWRFIFALSPLVAAALVALSRLRDHRHHWDDILAGMLLGVCVGITTYLHHYYPPWHHLSYLPYSGQTKPPLTREGLAIETDEEAGLKFRNSNSSLTFRTS